MKTPRRRWPGRIDSRASGGAFGAAPLFAQEFDHPAGFMGFRRRQETGRYPGFQQMLSTPQILGAVVFSVLVHEFQVRQLHKILHVHKRIWRCTYTIVSNGLECNGNNYIPLI